MPVRATIECERCGYVFSVVEGLTPGTATTREKIMDGVKGAERGGCPNCDGVGYGPLIQRRVARALCKKLTIEGLAPRWEDMNHEERKPYYTMARLVIAMLKMLDGLTLADDEEQFVDEYGDVALTMDPPYLWLRELAYKS